VEKSTSPKTSINMEEDWEAQDEEEIKVNLPASSSKWDDEDAADSAPEDWDASSDESPAVTTPKAPSTSTKSKKKLKQAIAAKESAQKEKLETAAERRTREQAQIEEADLSNAVDLFGGLAVASKKKEEDPLDKIPANRGEFTEWSGHLLKKTAAFEVYAYHNVTSRKHRITDSFVRA
jgi:hypothetical protein